MRIRSIKPEYWTDALLHTATTADVREFYIGLWMQADDAGYLRWQVDRIGAELYPYQPLDWRRTMLLAWRDELAALDPDDPLVVVLECERHVLLPTLTRHQRAARPVDTVQREHRRCMQVGAGAITDSHDSKVRESKVMEGKGENAGAGASEFRQRVPRP